MATQVEKWSALRAMEEEEEEALSLSDFPIGEEPEGRRSPPEEAPRSDVQEDFEFQSFCSGGRGGLLSLEETNMCAADEVFFQGQILPLRPSVSSRSESMDRRHQSSSSSSSTAASVSRSSSSTTISRSHSSSSSSVSSSCEPPRASVSSNFYSHPSPKPHLSSRANVTPRRKSTSSPQGWGILRLGLVRAPEIELQDLRQRKGSMSRRHDAAVEPKSEKKTVAVAGVEKTKTSRRKGLRSFGCRCSPDDAVEPTSASSSPASKASTEGRRKKGEDGRLCSSRRSSTTRTFQWLEELAAGKAPMA